MPYTVIVAEKPSVAASIAKVVGATTPHREKANGYLEGGGYRVTWAFGHLVGLDGPEDMGFGKTTLPILPEKWTTHIIAPKTGDMAQGIKRQMEILEKLFNGADRIIVATDAGREGELIFRYIYEQLGCRTPFDRLWISSLTDEAIRKGMSEIKPGREMNALSDAAHARSEADWLMGFNASRALRLASGYQGNLSLGRVQTPVLKMICDRYQAFKNFIPTPFWQVQAAVVKNGQKIPVLTESKYDNEDTANQVRDAANTSKRYRILEVKTKDITSKPPLLHDLTSLQRAANSKYSMTADETLRVAQSLYEKKFLSYPRTGSRYIPEDVFRTIPDLIRKISAYERPSFSDYAHILEGKKLCRRSVNDTKVTDHHALLPTGVIPAGLSADERKIWELVCGRMLEAFGEDSISKRTTVVLECAGRRFKTAGSVPVKQGWKSVFGAEEPSDEAKRSEEAGDDEIEAGQLPPLAEGETLPGEEAETVRKTDKPQPIYTDSSLLGEMETCGKKIDDEELRESMKDTGLGTPATRAAVIETLIKRGYVIREKKKLLPTELGLAIAGTVEGRKIADVRTTGEWERELSRIERGEINKENFDRRIRDYVLDIIDDLRRNCTSFEGLSSQGTEARNCPLCGRRMKTLRYQMMCDSEQGGCGLRIPLEAAGKKLTQTAVKALCDGKTTQLIKGFTSKSGKKFDARLAVDREERKVKFVFDEKPSGPEMQGRQCPCCGEPLIDDRWKLSCSCGFTVWKSISGAAFTENEIDMLISGREVPKSGLRSKAGKPYNAILYLDKNERKIAMRFENKPKRK